jgi:hypothetical protein
MLLLLIELVHSIGNRMFSIIFLGQSWLPFEPFGVSAIYSLQRLSYNERTDSKRNILTLERKTIIIKKK